MFSATIATLRAENDPTSALGGALVTPTVTPRAAITTPNAFGGSLRSIEDYQALRLFFCAGTNDTSRTAVGMAAAHDSLVSGRHPRPH
jgi:hypothetical protein